MRVARLFLFADWPEKYFSGQSEGGISNASGTRSVRVSAQGLSRSCCKLSPMKIPSSRLAAPGSPRMCAEVLANAIRNDNNIKGITVDGQEIEISLYADDTTLILDGSRASFQNSLQVLELFGLISGLRLNYKKTEVL